MSLIGDIVGGLVGLVGGGGSAKAEAVATTDVAVNPTINIANVTDLSPVQQLVDRLSGVNTNLAGSIVAAQAIDSQQQREAAMIQAAVSVGLALIFLFGKKLA